MRQITEPRTNYTLFLETFIRVVYQWRICGYQQYQQYSGTNSIPRVEYQATELPPSPQRHSFRPSPSITPDLDIQDRPVVLPHRDRELRLDWKLAPEVDDH